MIRGFLGAVMWTCLAGAVGIGLFFVKHEVKDLEGRLGELNHDIARNQEEMHVLKAEWSYLNDPARLRTLSERHLGMRPMGPGQVATLDMLQGAGAGDLPALARGEAPPPAKADIAKADVAAGIKPTAKPVQQAPINAPKSNGSTRPQVATSLQPKRVAVVAGDLLAGHGEAR